MVKNLGSLYVLVNPLVCNYVSPTPNLLFQPVQAWACLRVGSAPAGAVCPLPPDLACFLFDEEEGTFSYWGRNSVLRLVKATQPRWR